LNQLQEDICCSEQKIDESPVQFNESAALVIEHTKFEDIIPLFTIIQFVKLSIAHYKVDHDTLINLLSYLPNLNTLDVSSFSFRESDPLSMVKIDANPLILKNNKITKVRLGWCRELPYVQFFLDLCPFIKYLELKYWFIDTSNNELFLRFILTQNISNTPHLHSLGIYIIDESVDEVIEELEKIINSENLIQEYTIKYINDRIYLQWKKS
jgi:hypothetical protein